MNDVVWDLEIFPNVFIFVARERGTDNFWVYEISSRRNDARDLMSFLVYCKRNNISMIGFNNIGFDYPVLHFIIKNIDIITVEMIYEVAMKIIDTPFNQRFSNQIKENLHFVRQIDLLKVHHFDNAAKSVGLKVLEFNMRMENVSDLPFKPGTMIPLGQLDVLIKYCIDDVNATDLFCDKSEEQLAFRRELSRKEGRWMMNFNDTKIGKEHLIRKLEDHSPGVCYRYVEGRRELNQTLRAWVDFKDVVLPYINFVHPEFQRVHQWFLSNGVNTGLMKGAIDLSAIIRGFQFDFGVGGIHGSISPCTVAATDTHMILDIDVTSFYPSLAIVNRFYPAHLGEIFCDIYGGLKVERISYKKGTVNNLMLKLALNGSYGDTNNPYSPLYDPQYTMAITVNGQLLLCMLAESLMRHVDVTILQTNTDGMTIKFPRTLLPWVKEVMKWWEGVTGLDLEDVEYSRFWVRDVNNYIAEKTSGKLKRKGTYEHEKGPGKLEWHQNHSALVVKKAAEAALVRGVPVRQFIENHEDIYDFLLRTKVTKGSRMVLVDYNGVDHPTQGVSRYYISMFGSDLVKIMPPTPAQVAAFENPETEVYIKTTGKDAGKYYFADTEAKRAKVNKKWEKVDKSVVTQAPDRRISSEAGWKVRTCNHIDETSVDDIEYEWYIQEAEKLVNPILKGGVK